MFEEQTNNDLRKATEAFERFVSSQTYPCRCLLRGLTVGKKNLRGNEKSGKQPNDV